MRAILVGFLLAAAAPTAVLAQDDSSRVYELGELQVTARDRQGQALGGSTITGEQMSAFQKLTVDQALSLIPGTVASNTGGSRNERVVYIRGFDRFQTTISIDGVRVFLPADNRIDFARFLTADLSEIQVSKGYVSVLDGPGALGGAINLVTSKPVAPIEGELSGASFLDREFDQEAYQVSGRIGGRTGQFYWQASGVYYDRDHFTLSKDFRPTSLEDGGAREHSDSNDWRINVKAGWQPNDTDEYSINYMKSEGEKNAPYSVTDTANTRFWSWPYWNLDSLALLTRTKLTDRLTLKGRLYTNGFDNLLSAWDSAAQTTQSLPRAFSSYYQDTANGGNLELDFDTGDASQLKGVFYVRQDKHRERQDGFTRVPPTGSPSANAPYSEPWQNNDELTYSLAGQYLTGLGADWDLTVGLSYDWTDLRDASDVNVSVAGTTIANSVISFLPVNYPLKDNQAWNGQGALTWRPNDQTRLHFTVSSRARFPTLFERFSSRMGSAIPNPDVSEERATNYELGIQLRPSSNLEFSAAYFYSDIKDALIQIPVVVPGFGTVNQTKNVAQGTYYGLEAEFLAKVTGSLDVGGNYTHLHRELKDTTAGAPVRPQGTPDDKIFLYADYRPTSKISIRPSLEYASDRWTVTTTAPPTYYRTGDYTLLNLSGEYRFNEHFAATLAAQNLTDQNYQLTDGFPEAGRSFYASLRARF